LYALGIHADTGSLTYASTTDRDADAVAWLLRAGASLSMLNRYLRPTLSERQRDLLARMLSSVESVRVGAVDIELATVSLPKSMGGLSVVTTQACQLGDAAAFFALFEVGSRGVQLVGRSQRSIVDVGAIMKRLGGGGHREAGAAVLHDCDLAQVRERLLSELHKDPPRPRFVHELMSSPVRTVRHDETLLALRDSLSGWGHTGAPVMRDGKMVGVLSRRDIERAAEAGDLHLPASAWMTAPPRTIGHDASLDAALALMAKHDVGRLPVLEGGRLVGIVCRSDVLGMMYPPKGPGRN
jgi:tRNA nucleotidyltransferase (CCA-adding enzyme)